MTDLAARLQKVIEERLAVAHAARDSYQRIALASPRQVGKTVLLQFMAQSGPADAILECEFALALLDEMAHWRHVLTDDYLHTCSMATEERGGKCDCGVDARRTRLLALLAKRYGVEGGRWLSSTLDLRRVIQERLAVAHAATQGSWTWERRADGDDSWGDHGPWLNTSTATDESPFVLYAWGHDASGLEVTEGDMAHIELNDPCDAILAAEHALGILERHTQIEQSNWSRARGTFSTPACLHCELFSNDGDPLYRDWPCDEVKALAVRYGVEIDEPESQDQSHNASERGQSPDTGAGT